MGDSAKAEEDSPVQNLELIPLPPGPKPASPSPNENEVDGGKELQNGEAQQTSEAIFNPDASEFVPEMYRLQAHPPYYFVKFLSPNWASVINNNNNNNNNIASDESEDEGAKMDHAPEADGPYQLHPPPPPMMNNMNEVPPPPLFQGRPQWFVPIVISQPQPERFLNNDDRKNYNGVPPRPMILPAPVQSETRVENQTHASAITSGMHPNFNGTLPTCSNNYQWMWMPAPAPAPSLKPEVHRTRPAVSTKGVCNNFPLFRPSPNMYQKLPATDAHAPMVNNGFYGNFNGNPQPQHWFVPPPPPAPQVEQPPPPRVTKALCRNCGSRNLNPMVPFESNEVNKRSPSPDSVRHHYHYHILQYPPSSPQNSEK